MNPHLVKKLEIIKNTATLSRVWLVGGMGQLGRSFLPALNHIYGEDNILISDTWEVAPVPNYEQLDAIHLEDYRVLAQKFKPDLIMHLPALLSGLFTSHLRTEEGSSPSSQQQQFPERMQSFPGTQRPSFLSFQYFRLRICQ